MLTKQKGDIAEQATILQALRQGWGVCKPIGDRLPYDLVFDVDGQLIKIQVKSAWFDDKRGNYVVDTRRTKTNRREMIRDTYSPTDFDFAIVYIDSLHVFYVIPVHCFIAYGSEIHLVETAKRQRKPKSATFREAWSLLEAASLSGLVQVKTS
ncbi:group I intron-associated PD-(D/E)XK endonuclease [Spirosoma sordidisoli]|uniref:Endonuclease n=1 Tax=Spirosoma sordidisoli TaxID=2502893 RepID=A0A4Q2UJJ0_9BACT|nr:group I intron-associated PD-(D/E)XK endonuclease [Spirosoma sordidisoli]RYC67655.1 endonuclease [Spirosoma sordidisoli]